jgi:hypothetical protein
LLTPNQNDLLVTLQEFSDIACLDGRLFGVQTISDRCTLDLNSCLRGHALEALIAANRRAEKDLGYGLVPRYHVGLLELNGDGDKSKLSVATDWPGVAAVNVRQEITIALQGQVVNPYVGTAAITDEGAGFCVVTVPAALCDNPAKITLRDNDHKMYRTHEINGFPRKVGSDWKLALVPDDLAPVCASVSSLNVQHSQLVKVDIPSSTVALDCHGQPDTDAQILPVIPGTTDFIPLARPVEEVGSFYRYWFYVWNLVDPAFQDETVDLSHAEFWKLLSTVDFVFVREVEAAPEVTCSATDCHEKQTFIPDPCADPAVPSKYEVEIRDAEEGLLDFTAAKAVCPDSDRVTIKYYYKTDPAVLGFDLDLSNISTAIAYRAAAELPNNFCGCDIKTGFIAEAQKSFGDARVNPVTGETIWTVKFGHKNGHLMYEQKMESAPKFHKLRRF